MKYYVFDGSYVMLEIVEATYLNEANEETKFNAIDFSIYALQHVYTRYTPHDLRTYYSVESIIDGLELFDGSYNLQHLYDFNFTSLELHIQGEVPLQEILNDVTFMKMEIWTQYQK